MKIWVLRHPGDGAQRRDNERTGVSLCSLLSFHPLSMSAKWQVNNCPNISNMWPLNQNWKLISCLTQIKLLKIGGFNFLIIISSISFKNWWLVAPSQYSSTMLICWGQNFSRHSSLVPSLHYSISLSHPASHNHLTPSTVFGHLKLNSIHLLPKPRSCHHVTLWLHQL